LFLLGFIIGGVLIKLSPSLAVEFQGREATVGDLVRDVLAVNHARLVEQTGGWNEKEAWETLCRLIVLQTAVAREQITPEAHIVDYLGID